MDATLKVGITGTGSIAGTHAAAYRQDERVELVACCDIDFERAQAFTEQWGCKAYPGQDEMLRAEGLQIVSICTQPRSHMSLAVAALQAGVNVLCEKPLAASSEEGRRMTEAAAAAGRKLMVAVCHRFHEPVIRARQLLQEGSLGSLKGYYNAFVARVPTYKDRGGVLYDNGSHSVDFYRFLVGEPARVSAVVNPPSDDPSDATEVWATIQSQEGVPGSINLSFDVVGGPSVVALYGSEGTAVVDYDRGGLLYKLGESDWVHEQFDLPGEHRFARETAHFVDCVINDEQPGPDGWEGVKDLELIEAIWSAARQCP